MGLLHAALLTATALVGAAWIALALHVLHVQRRRLRAGRLVASALERLNSADAEGLPPLDRLARVRDVLNGASRELVMRAAIDQATPGHARETLARFLIERWGEDGLITDAARHATARDKWRRMAALQILVRLRHSRSMELLTTAVEGSDPDVAAVAISLLGASSSPAAAAILIRALQEQRHETSRVAAYLDRTTTPVMDQLRVLLNDRNPAVRQWAAALMGRYSDHARVEEILLPLADDPAPGVRKAAIESLGRVGGNLAAQAAMRLLLDATPYVRAHAARARGDLGRADLSSAVATRLGDTDWWVRRAAKEALVAMGPDVWPVLMHCLEQPDRFMSNGAAEVFQNLGILDSLIVMEAASDTPSASKIAMLRRIADAGGVRFTDSLVERAGPGLGPRVRDLLSTMGLVHVGAA